MAITAKMKIGRINYGDNMVVTPTTDLTGSIDTTASTAVVGVGTAFTTELEVGDEIIVSGERREVATITDNTNLTVTVAFSDNPNDTDPRKVLVETFPEHLADPIASRRTHYPWSDIRLDMVLNAGPFSTQGFFFVNHNLTPKRAVTLSTSTDGSSYSTENTWSAETPGANDGAGEGGAGVGTTGQVSSEETLKGPSMRTLSHLFDPASTDRYMRLDIADTGLGIRTVSVGRIYFCEFFEPTFHVSEVSLIPNTSLSQKTRSLGGVAWTQRGQNYRQVGFRFEQLTDTDAFADVYWELDKLGITEPFVITFYPTDSNNSIKEQFTLYGMFEQLAELRPTRDLGRWATGQITVSEVW